MMECTFQVGDRVVCVDANDTNNQGEPELVEGHIYTVRFVGPAVHRRGYWFDPDRGPYANAKTEIRVHEVARRLGDDGFAAARFRPVKPLSFWIGEKQTLKVPA